MGGLSLGMTKVRVQGKKAASFQGCVPSHQALGTTHNMGVMIGNLWEFNLAKVVIVDVTDDYKLMQPPMPSDFYPVLMETWLPRHKLSHSLPDSVLVQGYLYDWHETPTTQDQPWYVGVVLEDLARAIDSDIAGMRA